MDISHHAPELAYYLQDLATLYGTGPAGGSKPIRRHMREVRTRLRAVLKGGLEISSQQPESRPVCAHLDRALDNGMHGPCAAAVRALSRFRPCLRWGYGYQTMPDKLKDRYAYAEIAGPRGPAMAEDIILGVVLLAPDSLYPSHRHAGITESYICLSGALSQNDTGVYVPGSMIHNPPEHNHRITTGRKEPCLLAYAWTGSREALAGQTLSFSRPPRRKG